MGDSKLSSNHPTSSSLVSPLLVLVLVLMLVLVLVLVLV
jgi:hypothetical protein